MRRCLLFLALAGCIVWPRPAAAACATPTAMFHVFDSFFLCGEPISAYAFQLGDPTTNTGYVPIACEQPDGVRCSSPASGVAGDGFVTIESDWSNYGVYGCPIGLSGPQRVVIVASAETSGEAILVSLSGANRDFGYAVDLAHPLEQEGALLPAACGPTVDLPRFNGGEITLRFHHPPIYTDCDPDSLGAYIDRQGGTPSVCVDQFQPDLGFGPVYTLTQACADPVDFHKDGWTNTGVVPDADGVATLVFDSTNGLCRYTGCTTIVNGVETEIVTGVFAGDVDCADNDGDSYATCGGDCDDHDPAVHPGAIEVCNGIDDDCDGSVDNSFNPGEVLCDAIVAADLVSNSPLGKGAKVLTWTTNSEKSLVGFNVVVLGPQGTTQLNDVTIPCEGCNDFQSHSYAYLLPKHKNGNRLFIEILHRDGSKALWGPVRNPILPA